MPDLMKNSAHEARDNESRRDSVSPGIAPSTAVLPDTGGRDIFTSPGSGGDAAVSREDEANMRRALGMLGGSPKVAQPSGSAERRAAAYNPASNHSGAHSGGQASPRRHRFVQDGEVPVTVIRARPEHASDLARPAMASPANRVDALQDAMAAEQAARAAAERALEEAQASIRTLQTRLSHLELARDEAVAQAQHAKAQAEAAVAELAQVTANAEQHARPGAPASEPAVKAVRTARAKRPEQDEPVAEPEPVKWWLSPKAMRANPVKRRQRSAPTPD